MSDVDVVISCVEDAAPADSEARNSTVLQQFPGHSPILSLSPYFKAQASEDSVLVHTISFLKLAYVRCQVLLGPAPLGSAVQNRNLPRPNLLLL
jgi:hypothetical protein